MLTTKKISTYDTQKKMRWESKCVTAKNEINKQKKGKQWRK